MNYYITILCMLASMASFQTRAYSQSLVITNILGEHALSKEIFIEIYATTKEEVRFKVKVNGVDRTDSELPAKKGKNAFFYSAPDSLIVWVVGTEMVTRYDFSKKDGMDTNAVNFHRIELKDLKNPPQPVLDAINERKGVKKGII